MALNIPMPETSGQALMSGMNAGGQLFSRIMQPIIQREQLAEQGRYHQGTLAQQQQQLAQQHQQFLQELAFRKMQEHRLAATAGIQNQLNNMRMQKLLRESDPDKQLSYINKIMSGIDTMYGTQGQQGQLQNTIQQPLGGMRAPSIQDMESTIGRPFSKEQLQQGFLSPHQRKEMALGMMGYKIPKPYETPEQKHQGAISQAISIDEAKANRKKIDEIEKTAQSLLPYVGKVKTIEDILKRKPDLAGRTTQLADLLGMTKDEDVGAFLSAAQALQAHMAKEMSSRGGYGVAKLVEQAKPNIGKSTAYNQGVIKELKQGMKESFDQMKKEYERLKPGEKFPYNFEQFFQEQIGGSLSSANQKDTRKRLKFNNITGRLE